MKEVKTKTAAYSFIEDRLLLCRMLENADVGAAEVDENFDASQKLSNGKRYAVLVDARVSANLSKEGRERAHSERSYINLIAQAIVVDSLPNRLVVNFIIKFHKPLTPTRMFSNMESALKWLRKCMEAEKKAEAIPKSKKRRLLMW
jgi:hypothetical protein